VANSADFNAYVLEQLNDISDIQSRPFFGGTGLTRLGVQFAMLMGNTVYFVVDDTTRVLYEAEGSDCFSYNTTKKTVNVRKYYSVPAHILEEPDAVVSWARQSIQIALQAGTKNKKKS
jgi:DNA transformation protein